MVQKLSKNNLEYSKSIFGNSLKLMQPISSGKQQDFLAPLQNMLTETCENGNKLCQYDQEIITNTMNKINAEIQKHQQNASISKSNLFNMWNNQTLPTMTNIFKPFQDIAAHFITNAATPTQRNSPGNSIKKA